MRLRNKRLKFALAASVACIALLIGATLAYFTDRATVNTGGTAGTVKIALDDASFSLLNAEGKDNYNPGDGRLIVAPITNTGNKSVDVRQTFKLTMTPAAGISAFTAAPNTMGWALYAKSDCTKNAEGNWAPGLTAAPLSATYATADGVVTATYAIPEVVLNGDPTDANAETEAGVTTNVLNNDYVLVMLPGSDNSYQGASVAFEILAEAKQHRNTSGVSWNSLQTVTLTLASGGSMSAVPARNETSTGATIQ
ncbi:MAG: CalY family protein [Actinomycetia bacterium]|nr:CalY family protein [Actinomycetes bacterium]